jgi:hypothetical protein
VLEKLGLEYEKLLDRFMLYEAKFEVVCKMVFRIKIEVVDK